MLDAIKQNKKMFLGGLVLSVSLIGFYFNRKRKDKKIIRIQDDLDSIRDEIGSIYEYMEYLSNAKSL